MRKLPLVIIAALAASVAYGATMLMKPPPPSEASVQSGSLRVIDLVISATLPMAEPANAF